MINVDKIKFSYENMPVLKGISLEIPAGKVLTLLGPNGSGKTTLLKCLNASLKPQEGIVYLDGQDIWSMKKQELAKLSATLYQSHVAAFPYNVEDIVLMGRAPYLEGLFALPDKEDKKIVEEVLEELGISHFAQRPYTHLSGGERQLVLLARALAQQPKVLFLDEPTAPLDFKNTLGVLSKVRELSKKKNLVVIMSLHDPNHALLFSDLLAFVKKGEIVAFGQPSSIVTPENMQSVYNVEVDVLSHNSLPFIVPKIR